MRDAFPHPYTKADAAAFLGIAVAMQPRTWFAVTVDDRAVGGIGYTRHGDVERIGISLIGRYHVTETSRHRLRALQQNHDECVPLSWHHVDLADQSVHLTSRSCVILKRVSPWSKTRLLVSIETCSSARL